MTTSTITWHKPANYPDADVRVLIGLNIDGASECYEGFYDGELWHDSCAMPQDADDVIAWAAMPECAL